VLLLTSRCTDGDPATSESGRSKGASPGSRRPALQRAGGRQLAIISKPLERNPWLDRLLRRWKLFKAIQLLLARAQSCGASPACWPGVWAGGRRLSVGYYELPSLALALLPAASLPPAFPVPALQDMRRLKEFSRHLPESST